MIKLGIECENLEDVKSRWGIGQITLNLLEQYAANPEWQKQYKLYLYFKNSIPEDTVLKNPIFIKRVLGSNSFNIFYHIFLPIRAMMDRLDWMFFPAYMLPPLYWGKSVVMLTNDVYYEYTRGNLPFRYKLAYRLFTNWAAIRARKILAISRASRKELVKLYGIEPKRIFVSHLGVDENPAVPLPLAHDYEYILYIGQMFPRRHAKESILAFKKLAPEFPNLKFILVGKDKYNPPAIKSLITGINDELGNGRIIQYDYIEKREDIEKLYAGAKLFVYVSHSEAFGLPPVEAASYGVPVVVEDSDLNHELFGEAAFFVKNGADPDELSKVFRAGLTDDRKREALVKKYKEIVPRLSWQNFANNFFEQINE